MGKIVLLDSKVLVPGQQGYVQVRLAEPMVLAPGDRFLIRRHSPALSLGGGTVIELSNRKVRRFKDRLREELDSRHSKIQDTVSALLEFEMRRWKSGLFTVRELAEAVCQRTDVVEETLKAHLSAEAVLEVGRGLYVHDERFVEIARQVVEILEELHRAQSMHPWLDITKVRSRLQVEGPALQSLLKIMEENGQIETAKGGLIRRAGYKVELDDEQLAMAEKVKGAFDAAGLTPPMASELEKSLGLTAGQVAAMMDYLLANQGLVRIGILYFSAEAMIKFKEAVKACAEEHGEVVIPLIREQFGTTRKYIIPLMEHLDDIGMTRREGDRRFLAK
jgi:selenocysteine-specific elongation factor